jgi:hypothetical protein
VASISKDIFMRTPVNSGLPGHVFKEMLAGFGFQKPEKGEYIFYKYVMNFPKIFLIKNVEKKGNAIRTGISIAYPHCVNI